jgi:GT2 family glycosyltransferase
MIVPLSSPQQMRLHGTGQTEDVAVSTNQLASVVIPTRNRRELVLRCLASVYTSTYQPLEVIVVDDSSSDGTQEAIKQRFPGVHVLRNNERRLVTVSRNLGQRESSGQYIFFLDDDNVIDRFAIASLVEAMRLDNHLGVAAPVTYYLGDMKRIWWAGAKMNRLSSITSFPYKDATGLKIRDPYQSQMFHNAFMINRSAIKRVGFFDEKTYPIFLSEADYSERLRRFGFRVLVVPAAKVWHDVPIPSGSAFLSRRAMHITDPVRAYFVARNRILFMWRYSKISEFLLFFVLFEPFIIVMQLLSVLLSNSDSKARMAIRYLRGVSDAVAMGFRS